MRKLEVRYNNDMNTLRFKDFTQTDYDMLLCVCYQMNGLGTKEIEINYETIMDLMQWNKTNGIKEFQEEVYRVSDKLASTKGVFKNEKRFKIFNLFQSFDGDLERRTLKVQVSKDFMYILNDLQKDFTKIELKEYIQLDSKYAKTMYMQIRQRYKLNGHFWQPTIEELRTVLDIPEKYTPKIITRDVINPTIELLRTCKGLSDLEVEVIKARRKGSPVVGYRFTWTPNGQIKGQMTFDDYPGVVPSKESEKSDIEALIDVSRQLFLNDPNNPFGNNYKPKKSKNSFNNFEQNEYNFAELEEKLLDN